MWIPQSEFFFSPSLSPRPLSLSEEGTLLASRRRKFQVKRKNPFPPFFVVLPKERECPPSPFPPPFTPPPPYGTSQGPLPLPFFPLPRRAERTLLLPTLFNLPLPQAPGGTASRISSSFFFSPGRERIGPIRSFLSPSIFSSTARVGVSLAFFPLDPLPPLPPPPSSTYSKG